MSPAKIPTVCRRCSVPVVVAIGHTDELLAFLDYGAACEACYRPPALKGMRA